MTTPQDAMPPQGPPGAPSEGAAEHIRVVVADDHPMWRDAVARDRASATTPSASTPHRIRVRLSRYRSFGEANSASASDSSGGSGSGLGLAIVKRLVAADEGEVELGEAPGGGVDAVVRLRPV